MPEQIKKPTPTERLKETTAKLEAALVERDSLEKDILILNSELDKARCSLIDEKEELIKTIETLTKELDVRKQMEDVNMNNHVLREEFNVELEAIAEAFKTLREEIENVKQKEVPEQDSSRRTSIPYSQEAMHAGIRGMAGAAFNNAFNQQPQQPQYQPDPYRNISTWESNITPRPGVYQNPMCNQYGITAPVNLEMRAAALNIENLKLKERIKELEDYIEGKQTEERNNRFSLTKIMNKLETLNVSEKVRVDIYSKTKELSPSEYSYAFNMVQILIEQINLIVSREFTGEKEWVRYDNLSNEFICKSLAVGLLTPTSKNDMEGLVNIIEEIVDLV